MARWMMLVAAAVVACKSEQQPAADPSSGATTPTAIPLVDAQADASAIVTSKAELRLASFRDEVLDQCIDFTVTVDSDAEHVEKMRKWVEAFEKKLADDADKDEEVVRVAKPCMEQFKDRTVLASCLAIRKESTDKMPGVAASIHYAAFNFNFETVGQDDSRMQECLKMGGEWQALDRNSSEFREAQIRHNAATLQRTGEALERMTR